ncbi:hypothetical protein MMPV_006149 [Pyropia vietnamensis]
MAPTTTPPTAASIEPTVLHACAEVRASCDQLRAVLDRVARDDSDSSCDGNDGGADAMDGAPPPAVMSAAADALVRLKAANRMAATAAHNASVAAATAAAAASAATSTVKGLQRERAALTTRIATVLAAMPPLPPIAASVRDDDVDDSDGAAIEVAADVAAALHTRRLAAVDAELARRQDLLAASDRVKAAKRDSLRRRAAAEAFLTKLPTHARAVSSAVAPIRAFYPAPAPVEGEGRKKGSAAAAAATATPTTATVRSDAGAPSMAGGGFPSVAATTAAGDPLSSSPSTPPSAEALLTLPAPLYVLARHATAAGLSVAVVPAGAPFGTGVAVAPMAVTLRVPPRVDPQRPPDDFLATACREEAEGGGERGADADDGGGGVIGDRVGGGGNGKFPAVADATMAVDSSVGATGGAATAPAGLPSIEVTFTYLPARASVATAATMNGRMLSLDSLFPGDDGTWRVVLSRPPVPMGMAGGGGGAFPPRPQVSAPRFFAGSTSGAGSGGGGGGGSGGSGLWVPPPSHHHSSSPLTPAIYRWAHLLTGLPYLPPPGSPAAAAYDGDAAAEWVTAAAAAPPRLRFAAVVARLAVRGGIALVLDATVSVMVGGGETWLRGWRLLPPAKGEGVSSLAASAWPSTCRLTGNVVSACGRLVVGATVTIPVTYPMHPPEWELSRVSSPPAGGGDRPPLVLTDAALGGLADTVGDAVAAGGAPWDAVLGTQLRALRAGVDAAAAFADAAVDASEGGGRSRIGLLPPLSQGGGSRA